MAKDVEIVANDLMVYFRGLEVALGRGDVDDAIRYIKNIKDELDDNLSYLQSKKSTQEDSHSPVASEAAWQVGLYGDGVGLGTVLIDAVMSQTRCRKFLAGDGITTPEFSISAFPGVFEGLSVDARSAKKSFPAFGDAFSVAKNLDEYQYRICALVPSLPDSPAKVMLQKYRIAIAAAFAKLASVIRQDQGNLQAWTGHARSLLVEASDVYVAAAATTPRTQKPSIGAALAFFGLQENDVDRVLALAYGQWRNVQIQPICAAAVVNCATCGQECSDPIIVKDGKKTRHFFSGDCELIFRSDKWSICCTGS